MKTRKRFIYLMLVMSLLLAACGTLEVGVETPTTPANSVPMPITQTKPRMPLIRATNRWNWTTPLLT